MKNTLLPAPSGTETTLHIDGREHDAAPKSAPVELPRAMLEAMLSQVGIRGGIAGLPRMLALYFGAQTVAPEYEAVAVELAGGAPLVLSLSAGSVSLNFVVR